jgi:N-ethylmaleimide reductase
MKNTKLFQTYILGKTELKNRIVMAPMTRSRAIGNIPNELMSVYYSQRSGAGLIITEGTSPSPNGLGYARIPGIFNNEQIEGWRNVTSAVHKKGSKIFLQIMHTGRISHIANMPEGALILAPSAVKPAGQMWTDSQRMQYHPEPKAMTVEEIKNTKSEYANAASNAISAGFDGIELHGANGYLFEQFLSPFSNIRTDEYSGNIENRCRFVLEVVDECIRTIGKEKIGIRLSPYGAFNDMPAYPEIEETYKYLAERLNQMGISYIHLVDHSSMGAPEVPGSIKKAFREIFKNTLILSGGYNGNTANEELEKGNADLIAFGKPFINNPDFVERLLNGWELSTNLDMNTFYTPGEKGYTDYPFFKK